MIDQFNEARTGWARFSNDMTMRYRLARSLGSIVPAPPLQITDGFITGPSSSPGVQLARVVWLMLNPSTADAFRHDPTVGECIKRSRNMGGDVVEVVNLFAFRSPYPGDLKLRAAGFRGDDAANNEAILHACRGATFVVAAWGNDGIIGGRDQIVRSMLHAEGIELYHFGVTKYGHPKHPLARGLHRIPSDMQPINWNHAA